MQRVFLMPIGALLMISASALTGYAQADLPMPQHYVEDYANVINSSDEQSLNGVLQELEQKTGAQYIILSVQTTDGIPIEQFAIELAEKWKLGQKGKDNGMLFVLAKKDGRYRFEVGYGLEGFITDQYCGRVGREVLEPLAKQGNFSEGIYQANLRIAQKIATESGVVLTGMPRLKSLPPKQGRRTSGLPCCGILPVIFIMVLLFGGVGRGMGWWFFLPFMFGGFGGGMGGGFGGGGASGSW